MEYIWSPVILLGLFHICNGDFFNKLNNLDIDAKLNEIDKMMRNIDSNEDEAYDEMLGVKKEEKNKYADDLLSGLFGGDCDFKCQNGAKPTPKKNHKPSSNGCGSFGLTLEIDELPEMTSCCDVHDKCYDTCNSDRERCDEDFKKCLHKMCKSIKGSMNKSEYKGCKSTADLMYAGTVALGCTPYLEAQEHACVCGRTGHSETNQKKQSKPSDSTSRDKKQSLNPSINDEKKLKNNKPKQLTKEGKTSDSGHKRSNSDEKDKQPKSKVKKQTKDEL